MRRPRILTGRWRSSLPISRSSALEMERADSGGYEATGRQVEVIHIGGSTLTPPGNTTDRGGLERFARDHIDLSAYRADVDANFEAVGKAAKALADELEAEEPDADC